MKQRCSYKNGNRWHCYGGRGIRVCERWNSSFENFLADMGKCPPGLTLDRKDNDGDYEPQNCRWASVKDQQRNKTSNRLISFAGKTQCLAAWDEEMGFRSGIIRNRIDRYEWPVEVAITKPLRIWK